MRDYDNNRGGRVSQFRMLLRFSFWTESMFREVNVVTHVEHMMY
jgi:hypothetical protein